MIFVFRFRFRNAFKNESKYLFFHLQIRTAFENESKIFVIAFTIYHFEMPSKTSGFTTALVVYISVMINSHFISFSAVQIYDLSYIHLHCSFSTGTFKNSKGNSSLDISIDKALHRYRRGHGLESLRQGRTPNFFDQENFSLRNKFNKRYSCQP